MTGYLSRTTIRDLYKTFVQELRLLRKPIDTPLGFKLIGNKQMETGQFEVEETKIIKELLPSIDLVIDVGANIGYYCCLALKYEKQVVAFEPMHYNFRTLLRNIEVNGWSSGIEAYPLALSDRSGIIKIYGESTWASLVKGWANTPENCVSYIPCATMDSIIGSRFHGKKCLVIIDIEGAEMEMLMGATKIFDMEPKPIWMVEISIGEHQPKGIKINPNLRSTFDMFWERGYVARTADSEQRVVSADEVDKIVETGVDTLHTHNFTFVHP